MILVANSCGWTLTKHVNQQMTTNNHHHLQTVSWIYILLHHISIVSSWSKFWLVYVWRLPDLCILFFFRLRSTQQCVHPYCNVLLPHNWPHRIDEQRLKSLPRSEEFMPGYLAETDHIPDPSDEQLQMKFSKTCQPADFNEQSSTPING